ncbi:mCG20972, isoform CRA_c, partial [Mus musculus]
MHRLQVVLGHLAGRPESSSALQAAPCSARFPQASASDVVVVHGRRTPIGRASRGGFKPGAGAVMARIAQFLSGIPETVPLSTVNRQCSSGLQAVANIAGGIRNGSYDIGMACGVESMSLSGMGNPGNISSRLLESEKARDCLTPMGMTSENVAERFGISRQKQDDFALASQQKAASAQSRGCFRAEIVPVTTTVLDDKGDKKTITVSQDEGVRPSTTMQGLAKLKPAFKDGGSTTAG